MPGSTDAVLAVKTERFPPYGLPPHYGRTLKAALLTASLDPHRWPNGHRGCQPGDLKTRKDKKMPNTENTPKRPTGSVTSVHPR